MLEKIPDADRAMHDEDDDDDKAVAEFNRITNEICEESSSDLLFFSGPIGGDSLERLTKEMRDRVVKRKNVILFLTTLGGDAHCAFCIVKRIRAAYRGGKFYLFVHSQCASAGTLVAVGADVLIMSDTAELGPLDIQLAKADDLIGRMSGLTPRKAMATLRQEAFICFEDMFLKLMRRSGYRITLRTAAQIAVDLTTGLYSPIYEQIDPFRVAEVQRDNEIAEEYGKRVNAGNLKEDGLRRLINAYPAHEFIIDRHEAEEHLFKNVTGPTKAQNSLLLLMEPLLEHLLDDDTINVKYLCEPPTKDEKGEDHANGACSKDEVAAQDQVNPGLSNGSEPSSGDEREEAKST